MGQGRSVDRVRAAAETAGLALEVLRMPGGARTAEDAAAACGASVAQIVKSLVFRKRLSREPVLLLVSGARRVDQARMTAILGEPLERMDAGEVRALTGFAIGGVAPLGSLSPLVTYMDRGLLAFATVWAAAGAPDLVFEVAPDELARAALARIIVLP